MQAIKNPLIKECGTRFVHEYSSQNKMGQVLAGAMSFNSRVFNRSHETTLQLNSTVYNIIEYGITIKLVHIGKIHIEKL